VLDQFDLEAVWLFPTLGVLYEELLVDDPEGVGITFRPSTAGSRKTGGFHYQDRIFAAP